ncbi:MAG: PAS domain S-box protein [Pirellulales bacterium]|nr:PAS domain S-box protein [Pirellulales bacterium]
MAEQNDGPKHAEDRRAPIRAVNSDPGVETNEHTGEVSGFRELPNHLSACSVGDGLSVSDRHDMVIFVNDRLCAMIGYSSDELLGRSAATFISSYSRNEDDTETEVCSHCGRVHHKAVLRCKDGSLLRVTLDRRPMTDPQGAALGTLYVITDITEKTLLEQTLQDNAEWHRLIVDNLNDIFWVAEVKDVRRPVAIGQHVDPKSIDIKSLMKRWRFIYVSPSFERLVGYPVEDAFRMHLHDLVPAQSRAVVDETIQWYACEAMNTPEGGSIPQALRFPLLTASGSACWSETTARILYDNRRNLLRVVGITRDITERYLAEEAVRASEEKLAAICNAAQDAVVVMDADGRTIHWNAAAERMFGYRQDEVLGREMHALLVPSRLHEKIARGIDEFRRSGQGAVVGNIVQSVAVRKDGSEFPVEIGVSPITIDGRRSAVGIVRDITERTLAEEAVRREQRCLAQLLDVHEGHRKMATYEIHDGVTQPLVSALMTFDAFSEARRRCPDAPWNDFDAAVGILREALSETRRFMSGMRPPVLDEFGVVAALDHLIREQRLSSTATIEFICNVNFERLAPPLETTVFRIVQEGLVNAIRHSQADAIRVELIEQGSRLQVLLQDEGVGFNPTDVAQDHFGLEGIRERVTAMGGDVQIESAPGAGTRISVDLPLLVDSPADMDSLWSDETAQDG